MVELKLHLIIVDVVVSDEFLGLFAFKAGEASEVRQFDSLLVNKMGLQASVSQENVAGLKLRQFFAEHFSTELSSKILFFRRDSSQKVFHRRYRRRLK